MSQEKQLDEEILEKSQAVSSQEQASDEGLQESSTEEVSMSPTMKDGQLWFSTVKQIRHPKKGDVVTAFDVLDHVYLVKRLVATEGDRVKPTEEGLYINGELIDSSEETKKLLHDSSTWVAFNQGEEVTLKKGEYFLVGDNLEHSNDSRRQGIYPEETIRTVVQFQAPNWLKTVLKVKTH